jgi:hypothetical protein
MKSIDRWSAEKAGVIIGDNPDNKYWSVMQSDGMLYVYSEWTLDDARCREIVREHFKIDTVYAHTDIGYNRIICPEGHWYSRVLDIAEGIGKTPAESELLCIEAIKQSEE